MFDSTSTYPLVGPALTTGQTPSNRFQSAFPDPSLDYASTQMPRSIYDVFRWAEFFFLSYRTYATAMARVVSYFLTKIELTDASDDEKEKFEKFLDEFRAMEILFLGGLNRMCYGNAFACFSVPFRRFLRCPKCHMERPFAEVKPRWDSWQFVAKCASPKCNFTGPLERVDRRSIGLDPLRVVFIPPQEMRLQHHPMTGHTEYHWEISSALKTMINAGNEFYLERTPWEIIMAIKEKNKLFTFAPDVIYHLKEPVVAGVRSFGWGIPIVLGNFRQAWLIQTLKRYNEAICLDEIIPFRTITPEPGSSREADPILHTNLSDFTANVMGMFAQHRKDPTSIHSLPFPIKFDVLGAQGKDLAPVDLIDKATDEFLNGQGVPAEMYRGTLEFNVLPAALRLFERTWVNFVGDLNGFLGWMLKQSGSIMRWENLKGKLQPVTYADNIEDKQTRLMLAGSMQISKGTAYAPFGITDIRAEIKKTLQEQEIQEEETARYMKERDQKRKLSDEFNQGAVGAMQQQPGAPGAPQQGAPAQQGQDPNQQGAPQGGAQPTPPTMDTNTQGASVEEVGARADQLAQQLLAEPDSQRKSDLLKLKKTNPTLHALTISRINDTRRQAQQQGGQQMLAQMAQQMNSGQPQQ